MNLTDQSLNEVTLAQLTFKPGPCRSVAVAIAKSFDESPTGSVWADEVPLPALAAEDKNVIGTTWRNLAKWKIIQRLEGAGDHRRSTRKGRKGGVVFRYQLRNRGLLQTFLRRNNCEPAPLKAVQQQLI